MATDYYNSVNEWLEAGRPLDAPFLVVREYTMGIGDADDEDYVLSRLRLLCTLIVSRLTYYRDELGGSGYRIEPASPVLYDTRDFDHEGETFGVHVGSVIVLDQAKVCLVAGAIATILS